MLLPAKAFCGEHLLEEKVAQAGDVIDSFWNEELASRASLIN